jgi:hypothetical protein
MGTLLDDFFFQIDAMIGGIIFLWVCSSHFTFSDRQHLFGANVEENESLVAPGS